MPQDTVQLLDGYALSSVHCALVAATLIERFGVAGTSAAQPYRGQGCARLTHMRASHSASGVSSGLYSP